MIYYGVISIYHDDGRITSNLVDVVEAEEQPKDKSVSYRRKDVYTDWFDNKEQALAFVELTRKA